MGRRILINTYRIAKSERASFLNLARSSQKDQPNIENFGFQVYAHPEEHDFFAEIFILPDPAVAGTKAAMEAYHFSSSYQPERDSCIKLGTRLISFRGSCDDSSGPIPLDSAAIRYSPLRSGEEEQASLEASMKYVAENRQHQVQILPVPSSEFTNEFALLEFFSTTGDYQLSQEQNTSKDEWIEARENIDKATLRRYDLPAVFVRFR